MSRLNYLWRQIELYNQMVEKEGTDGEEEARKAFYHAARPTQNHEEEDPKSPADHVSSALIERVFSHRNNSALVPHFTALLD